MSGSRYSMLDKGSIQSRKFGARLAFCVLFLIAWISLAFAQEPPLNVLGAGRLPARDPNAISIEGWLLYPTLRVYSLYSDNLFLSPQSPIAASGIGVTPSLSAVWSNGIHTTTLYGNIDRQAYPTDNDINTLDGRAGFTQRYEALRDLIFTVNGNYAHQTLTTGLQNSIQTAAAAPTTTVLPNGNTQLPNGTILSPSGQIVGQANPAVGSNAPLLVNPSDQFAGTFSVEKIFNRGMLNLSGTVNRTEYQNTLTLPNTSSTAFTESAGFWLGPVFYAYSNGSIGTVVADAANVASATNTSTTSYRVIGGLGTRQYGLFRGSVYFGHQGSDGGGTTAGGEVYGGALSFYPTPRWTLTGTVDETVNIASQGSATNLALTLPAFTPVQVALGTSTRITSASLRSSYEITPQWFANCQLAYNRFQYVDSPRLDHTWVLDATLRYDIWRNMSLTWEYRYRSILSNSPFVSATSNYITMGSTYKF
jgi:Putative beta-barrel porin 2